MVSQSEALNINEERSDLRKSKEGIASNHAQQVEPEPMGVIATAFYGTVICAIVDHSSLNSFLQTLYSFALMNVYIFLMSYVFKAYEIYRLYTILPFFFITAFAIQIFGENVHFGHTWVVLIPLERRWLATIASVAFWIWQARLIVCCHTSVLSFEPRPIGGEWVGRKESRHCITLTAAMASMIITLEIFRSISFTSSMMFFVEW